MHFVDVFIDALVDVDDGFLFSFPFCCLLKRDAFGHVEALLPPALQLARVGTRNPKGDLRDFQFGSVYSKGFFFIKKTFLNNRFVFIA